MNPRVPVANAVDATYRGDLRELNELNFARFDAKLEQRFAESEGKAERRFTEFERMTELRFAEFERRFVALESKLDTKLDSSVAQHAFAQLESRMERGFAEARANLEKGLKDQTRFFFVAWSGLLIALIGLRLVV